MLLRLDPLLVLVLVLVLVLPVVLEVLEVLEVLVGTVMWLGVGGLAGCRRM